MVRVFLTIVVTVLFMVGMVATAQVPKPKDGKVICCHDGKCDTEHTLAECAKLGGKVVKDCKDCK